MGKASKWLRGIFGLKKADSSASAGAKPPKKKWGFVKSYREKDQPTNIPATIPDEEAEDPSRHAIKLAAATAVVAEAAVAAAQAAAEVVRLTSSGRAISGNSNSTPSPSAKNRISRFANATVSPASVNGGEYGFREDTAAVVIQSYFRGYLSKRALRALRALVRLQAIVRGRIWRKKYANQLNHWKELLRTHNLVNAGRVAIFESPQKGPATPEKSERMKNGENLVYKRNASQNKFRTAVSRSEEYTSGIDHQHPQYYQNVQPQMMHKPRNLFHSSHLSISDQYYSQGFEVQSSTSPFKFSYYVEDDPFWTAESSPQKRGTMTPTRSDGSRSCLSGYSDCPNYMTCTESSKAKTRSLSAPRQRPAAAQQYERSSSTTARRLSMIHGYGQRVYPGSGRLDRMGMPVTAIKEEGGVGFSGGLWHRF